MGVFDEDFDMLSYTEKRVLAIEDLKGRQMFKEVIAKLFIELYGEVEKQYSGLEARVFDEVPPPTEGPEVSVNIVEKQSYDATDTHLLPMCPEDLDERTIDSRELLEKLKQKENFYLYTIFLEEDYLLARKFDQPKRIFRGVIKTEHSEYNARFSIRQNVRYREKIEELYQIFQINYLPWRSVCAPYLFKLFDVYIEEIENWDPKEKIMEAVIDFEEYKQMVRYDQVPLWNIKACTIKTSTYPEPAIDKINYEHRIFKHKFAEGARYLVTNQEIKIMNIRWVNGDLLITCPLENPVKWSLYQFSDGTKSKYARRTTTNAKKNTFTEKLMERSRQSIKTKLELSRLLHSFAISEDLEFIGARIVDHPVEKETYYTDYFILDEIRAGTWQRALVVDFRAKRKDCYLNRDVMSFLMSCVQRYFPEYECLGRLV